MVLTWVHHQQVESGGSRVLRTEQSIGPGILEPRSMPLPALTRYVLPLVLPGSGRSHFAMQIEVRSLLTRWMWDARTDLGCGAARVCGRGAWLASRWSPASIVVRFLYAMSSTDTARAASRSTDGGRSSDSRARGADR